MSEKYPYDVALSFAGEQREYALRLAQKLNKCNLDVFYDDWAKASLWGTNLIKSLSKVYSKKALYCVVFFSKEYCNKVYPKMEFEHMQYRQYEEEQFILPISIDGCFPEEWPKTRSYVDINKYTIDEIALMIRDIVKERKKALKNELSEAEKDDDTEDAEKHITITDENGNEEEAEVLLSFRFTDVDHEYCIYTKNEMDEHGNITIYAASVERKEDGSPLLGSVYEEDWDRIKQVLYELSQDVDEEHAPYSGEKFFTKDGIELL